jgi:hypothetical protein
MKQPTSQTASLHASCLVSVGVLRFAHLQSSGLLDRLVDQVLKADCLLLVFEHFISLHFNLGNHLSGIDFGPLLPLFICFMVGIAVGMNISENETRAYEIT